MIWLLIGPITHSLDTIFSSMTYPDLRTLHLGHILVFIFSFDMHMVDLVSRNDNGWCRISEIKKKKQF